MTCSFRYFINIPEILLFSLSLLPLIGALPNVINETTSSHNGSQLKHVHVIFSHKLYAPIVTGVEYGFPERLDYRHFLEKTWDMSNEHKMELFDLGVYLRERYDDFLGGLYYPEVMEMRTSEYYLSMVSGILVNAGLWPPIEAQKWKDDLNWQPIPSVYEQVDKDTLLLGSLCPHFQAEEQLLLEDEAVKAQISMHEPLFTYVTDNYGKKIDHPKEIALLYSCFETIATDPNTTLPAWAEGIFPHGEMRSVSLLSYDLLSRTTDQKHLNGGNLVKKILEDSRAIAALNNTLGAHNESRDFKLSIYSAEERNLVGVLQALNLWSTPHIPANGASIILELRHDPIKDVYGLEIFYYTGAEDNETIALILPRCEVFCPLDDFARILDEVLPVDENTLCHATSPVNKDTSKNKYGSSAPACHQQPYYLSHFFFPLLSLLLSKF